MHFFTAFSISKTWMLSLDEAQAIMFFWGWKIMLVIWAWLLPLYSTYTSSPVSLTNIRIIWPACDEEAIKVPSELIARAPISLS